MTDATHSNDYCSELSARAGEQVFATASRVDVWFLLEYAAPWAKKALDASAVPAAVKQRLDAAAQATRHARIQMIKRAPRAPAPIAFYAALSREVSPLLYKFELGAYEELLDIDLAAVVAGDPRYDRYVSEQPVFLVCTHGAHDRCCARFGLPAYNQLASRADVAVWQTSHVGGHRFAANMVWLPDGVYDGRIHPAEATSVIAAHLQQRVQLDKYRGRSCHDPAVQAADYFLRTQMEILELRGLQFLQSQPLNDSETRVDFLATADGTQHTVHIVKDNDALQTYTSCGAAEPSSIAQFRLSEHHIVA